MKRIFTSVAVLLAALFLGSGCATSTCGAGKEKAATAPPAQVVSPAVAAPQ
ncbi:MAG: hypothetical protein ABSG14_03355 [Verrucomicrobiia bacterium]|jgi:hypothetical protein